MLLSKPLTNEMLCVPITREYTDAEILEVKALWKEYFPHWWSEICGFYTLVIDSISERTNIPFDDVEFILTKCK